MAVSEKERKRRFYGSVPERTMSEMATEEETEIDLLELLYSFLDNLKYIVLAALVGTLIAGIYSYLIAQPVYQATAKLYVTNSKDSALNLSDLQIGSYLTKDYQEVFKTWEVHEMVTQNLGIDYTYTELQEKLTVSNPSDTRILYITASADNPQEAVILANEYSIVAKNYISQTMATEEPNILSAALQPTNPVSPNKTMNMMMGFLLGALVAIAIITIRFVMDDKVKTPEDVQKYIGSPTLAVVPVAHEVAEKGAGSEASTSRRQSQ